ncbi:DUF2326 domain-containing protein, partial [Mycoplasmopsis bovis]
MYLKSLKISKGDEVIRYLEFKKGLNLIVDSTLSSDLTKTGNNIGKTTVLKLINFCLGGNTKEIYSGLETKTINYELKEFLETNKVLITLELTYDIYNDQSEKIIIERNFLSDKNNKVLRVNNKNISANQLSAELLSYIFPKHKATKPTFRQIISHNIRYTDQSINNTLKTVHPNTNDSEYEMLYLFLFGFSFDTASKLISLKKKLEEEKKYQKRLLSNRTTRVAYEQSLEILSGEITELNNKKNKLDVNEKFKDDLECLNKIKYNISQYSTQISLLNIRKNNINDFIKKIKSDSVSFSTKQVENIYQQSKLYMSKLHKTFDELINFHNKMIDEKVAFASSELPSINNKLDEYNAELTKLLDIEKDLSIALSKEETFKELDKLIKKLNEKHQEKGALESKLEQIIKNENDISETQNEIENLNKEIYSDAVYNELQKRIKAFNDSFQKISNLLYNERYFLVCDRTFDNKQRPMYRFDLSVLNQSSGKKQGEIICFDLAYIKFADEQKIPCLHFLLNDKKELMSDNQLIGISNYLLHSKAQLIISILKDKIPEQVLNNSNIVLELSQNDKLF